MFYPDNIPWPQIHEYILEVGNERLRSTLLKKALADLNRLIQFDTAHLVYSDGKFHILRQETIDIPESSQKTYPVYFQPSNMLKTWLPENPWLFYATTNMFRNSAFGEEWVKPLGLKSSTGFRFVDVNGENVLFILYRSSHKTGFNELEIAMLDIIRPHIINLVANLHIDALKPSPQNIINHLHDFRQLTQREAEVTTLICRGYNTQGICSKLHISPETLYRHTNNIYQKLNISNRQELLALIMGTSCG